LREKDRSLCEPRLSYTIPFQGLNNNEQQ